MKKYSSITRVNSRRTSPIKKRVGLILFVGLVASILLWLLPYFLGFLTSLVLTPIQSAQTWFYQSSENLPTYLRDRAELIAENNSLREQIATADSSQYSFELLTKKNEELRSLLGNKDSEKILAGIIGRPNKLPYDVLVIDQGSRDGVQENVPVFIGDNRVIGQVVKVFQNSSIVELVTTPNFESSVYIVGPDIYTTAIGVGGGQLRVGVPQGIEIAVGDHVILPAVENGYFGTINHTESLPTRPEQYGYVSTDVPLQSLRYVAVGTKPLKEISFEEAQSHVQSAVDSLFTVPVPEGVLVVTVSTSSAASSTVDTATTTSSSTTDSEI